MITASQKLKDSQVELTVTLGKEELLRYAVEAEKSLADQLKIEGFRPGKAPKEMVRKTIGEQAIKEEALNLSIQKSLAEALEEQHLDVIDQADFKIKENSSDKLVYAVKLLVFPEVKLGDYKGLNIAKNPIAVTEAEMNSVLNDVVKSRTVLREVERPAKMGDKVEVDFEVKDRGVLIDGGKSENHPVILGENKFIPGFEEQLVGLKAGENKDFSLKAPADYYQKAIAGKELTFHITLKKVNEMAIPRVDDELARGLGRFASKDDLLANIREGLTLEKEAKEKERLRLALLKQVAEKTKVEIPAVLIEKRLNAMIQGFDNELHQKGMELGLYLAHIKKTQDDLKRDWHGRAEDQVKFDLIAGAIAKEEKLRVTDEEVTQELQAVLQQYMASSSPDGGPGPGPEMLQNIDPEQLKNRIRSVLLNEKVFEFLEKHNSAL